MPAVTDLAAPCLRLSPPDQHFFFGYYDLPAADAKGRHLALQVQFRDRFATPDDVAVLGWLPLPHAGDTAAAQEFTPFAETVAWNFQQACMLQWLPPADTCLYNTFDNGAFGCCVHNIATGEQRRLPRAVTNVAQDGTKALCVNMPRIYDFRPGYGYEEIKDPFTDVAAPEDDGVFLMDLASGESRMILSLAEAVDFLAANGEEIVGRKVVINHITFNPSGDRYLFLLRNFPEPGGRWDTWLVTGDSNGGGLRYHNCYSMASHYHWRDDRNMLFYMMMGPQQPGLVLVDDDTGALQTINPELFPHDGHCSYSPDLKWMLYDSYPGPAPDHLRSLFVYSVEHDELTVLGRFRSEALPREKVDLRCDLHPVWMPDGKSVSFDSIHEGYRGIYWVDLGGIVG